jgi:hypothetical protein
MFDKIDFYFIRNKFLILINYKNKNLNLFYLFKKYF